MNSRKEAELKRCPFCGWPKVFFAAHCGQKEEGGWVVECPDCCAIGPCESTAVEAVESWNRRAALVAPAAPYCSCAPTMCQGEGINRCRWKLMNYAPAPAAPKVAGWFTVYAGQQAKFIPTFEFRQACEIGEQYALYARAVLAAGRRGEGKP